MTAWSTLTLTVTTPMFSGGADQQAEARVPSLRGAMRFWFRALAGYALGDDIPAIASAESEVFGDTDHSSPVLMRIPNPPPATENRTPDFLGRTTRNSTARRDRTTGFPGVAYLLGPGLTKWQKEQKRTILTRSYLGVGTTFDVQLRRRPRCTDEVWDLTVASLWLVCNFGGIGARVRRGFGGVAITGLDNLTLPPYLKPGTERLDASDYRSLSALDPDVILPGAADAIRRVSNTAPPASRQWGPRTSYPVLGPDHTRTWLYRDDEDPWPTWDEAFLAIGYDTRIFRAVEDAPGARYVPKLKTKEWLNVVHGNQDRFPLGAMGLPVIFKKGYEVNAMHDRQKVRRASPLWLRFVPSDNGWYLFSLFFRTQFFPHVPNPPYVHLSTPDESRDLTVGDAELNALEHSWFRGQC